MGLPISVKRAVRARVGTASLCQQPRVVWTFYGVASSDPEAGMRFHLLVFSLIPLISVLSLSVELFHPLVRLVPERFILFVAIVNKIVSLIPLSDGSLFVSGNTIDFRVWICILQLC